MSDSALPVHERPFTSDRYSTAELPDTPTRSFRIAASSWIEAPEQVLRLGDDLGEPVEYKRWIGEWLLWRAGPAVGRARYMAISEEVERGVFGVPGLPYSLMLQAWVGCCRGRWPWQLPL